MDNSYPMAYPSPRPSTHPTDLLPATSKDSLIIPAHDVRDERLIYDTEEKNVDMRKRTMGVKTSSKELPTVPDIIKTGDDRIDAHCARSTLPEQNFVDMIELFRADRLREYYDVIKLCKENEIVLTKLLIQKALLYPGDRPVKEIKGCVRQPGLSGLLPQNFYKPQQSRSSSSNDDRHFSQFTSKRNRFMRVGERNIPYGLLPMVYPFEVHARAKKTRENLSTGRATVSRKLDCWMTFEEYEKLTGTAAVKYLEFGKEPKYNPYWPGQFLDTLALCMPPYDRPPAPTHGSAVFQELVHEKVIKGEQCDNGAWPVGEGGVVQIGHLHKADILNYTIN